jgi:hypothetical protein
MHFLASTQSPRRADVSFLSQLMLSMTPVGSTSNGAQHADLGSNRHQRAADISRKAVPGVGRRGRQQRRAAILSQRAVLDSGFDDINRVCLGDRSFRVDRGKPPAFLKRSLRPRAIISVVARDCTRIDWNYWVSSLAEISSCYGRSLIAPAGFAEFKRNWLRWLSGLSG